MDFSAQTKKVEQWTLENNKYELLSDIPTERKLIFKSRTNRDVSFYIICPVSEEGKWVNEKYQIDIRFDTLIKIYLRKL